MKPNIFNRSRARSAREVDQRASRRHARRVSLALAMGAVAFWGVACGDAGDTDGGMLGPPTTPLFDFNAPPNGPGQCMFLDAKDAGYKQNKLQCTAEDIDIADVDIENFRVFFPGDPVPDFEPLPPSGRISCLPGQTIQVNVDAILENNAQQRYDIGLWINPNPDEADPLDPGNGANMGSECLHFNLVNGAPGVSILDNTPDSCGDMMAGSLTTVDLQTLTFQCTDPDGNGEVDLDACTAWENNTTGANEVICPLDPPGAPEGFRQGTTPGTGSKCKCEQLGLPIDIRSVIRVAKVTVPDPDPTEPDQEFDFTPSGTDYTTPFSLSNGQTNESGPLSAGTYSVSETVPTGWDLTSATCDNGDNPSNITLGQGDIVTCTFTNTKRGNIIVKKETDPDGSAQLFTFSTDYSADFQLADGGENDSGPLQPGTYSVSETVPAGWELKSATCDDGSDPSSIGLAPGETVTCTFNNEQDAFITVVKVCDTTDPNPTQTFDFTSDFAGGPGTLECGGSKKSDALDPGAYAVSETVPAGWALMSAACDNGDDPATITLAAGDDITCTFTNTEKGVIIVKKETDPDGSSQLFSFSTSYSSDFQLADGGENNSGALDPGTYSVSETVPPGWELKSATCDDGSDPSSIGLGAGETVTCTFTNEQDAAIIVKKETDPDGSPQLFTFSTSYSADFQLADGGMNNSGALDPGTYSVSETVPAGWELKSATCDDGSDPSSIGLGAGEVVTCTFNNEQDANIIVKKETDPDGSPQLFTFSTSYGADFQLADGGMDDSGALDPGTYSVSETVPAGWELTSASCDDGSDPSSIGLSAGETVTCTFNNEQDAFIIVKKETDPDGSPQLFTFSTSYSADFQLADGGMNTSSALDPGTYSVSETVPFGWEFTSASCDDGSDPANVGLSAGETVTCTFFNTQIDTCEQGDRVTTVTLELLPGSDEPVLIEWTDDNGSANSANYTPVENSPTVVGETFTIEPEGGATFFDSQNLRFKLDGVVSKNLKVHLSCSDDPQAGFTTYSGNAQSTSVDLLLVSLETEQFN